jgi:hypothetical protein
MLGSFEMKAKSKNTLHYTCLLETGDVQAMASTARKRANHYSHARKYTPGNALSLTNRSSSPPATPNILTKPIPTNLLPLNLLPRDRKLPPQTLKRALTQARKRLIQIFLVLFLFSSNLLHDICPSRAQLDFLGCEQPHVAVLVVVHVDFYAAGDGAGGGAVDVAAAPAAVPVV